MTGLGAARALFAALFLLVTYLTLAPNPDDSGAGFAAMRWLSGLVFGDAAHADKAAHFTAYAALGLSAALGRLAIAGRAAYAFVALAAYGALLEAVQGAMGTREAELLDALANAAGAGVGGFSGVVLGAMAKARAG